MQPLLDGLTQLGATSVSTKGDGFAPVVMKGPLHAGHALIADGRDSQPISALLIAASFLEGTTTLRVEHPGEEPWIDMTLDWLKRRGVACQHQDYRAYQITGAPIFPAFDYTVPGDFSSIAFPVVAALLSGITLNIHGLDHQDVQGDKKIVEVLRTMGACVQEEGDALIIMPSPPLTGAVIDANDMIDAVPILAVLGCFCTGPLRLIHASNARHKESNRLVAMVEALSSMGARIQETDDGLLIHPSSLKGATLSSHRDHRVAMACAVAAWHAEGPSVVLDIDCIQKTYAPFFDEMAMLGFQSEIAVKE
jgi:3-phosphoshikimate 1-carboxyvinyltransferase